MSKICKLLRNALKDEKEAVPFYEKLKSKMLSHTNNKKIISKIQDDEKDHYKKIRDIAEELGCNCNKS